MQVVYKKLLNGVPTFVDLMDAQPSLAKGLQALLQYDGDDVADVFCRTFEAEFNVLDAVRPLRLLLTSHVSSRPMARGGLCLLCMCLKRSGHSWADSAWAQLAPVTGLLRARRGVAREMLDCQS